MKWLIRILSQSRVASNLLLVGILAAGISALMTTTIKLFPETNLNQIVVTVSFPGSTPGEVENSIIQPIEESIEGLEDIRQISSTAAANVGQVVIELNRGANSSEVLDEVKSEIDRIQVFPEAAEDPQIVLAEPRELILRVGLTADLPATEHNLKTLKQFANQVRDDLIQLAGVSQVELDSVPEYEISITVPRAQLHAHQTSLSELARIIDQQSLSLAAGDIKTEKDRLLIRTLGENKTGEEFADIIMFTSDSGAEVRLRDLAEVHDGLEDTALITRLNGKPTVILNIFRSGDEEVLHLADQVQTYLTDTLEPQLPSAVSFDIWRNDAEPLRNRIRMLVQNGTLGFFLVLIVLSLFLDLRVAAWIAVGVFASFMGAFGLMSAFGISINSMTLFGFILAIGIVVDDAIVVGENVYRHRQRQPPGNRISGLDVAVQATQRVARPVFLAVSTTIIAFVPLMFLPGLAGQFVDQVAAVVIFTLVLSLIEAFFILPHHLAHLSPDSPGKYSPRRLTEPVRERVDQALWRFNQGPLLKALNVSVRHPLFIIACAGTLLLGAIGLVNGGYIKFVFFPDIEGNYVNATLEVPPNSPESLTLQTAQTVEASAREAARVIGERYGLEPSEVVTGTLISVGRTARTQMPGQAPQAGTRTNFATLLVRIMEANRRPFSSAEFEDEWRRAIPELAGLRQLSLFSTLVDIGAAVALEVSADNEATVNQVTEKIRTELAGIEGVHDIRDDRYRTTQEVALRLKPEARRYDLSLSQLAESVRAATFGVEAVRVQRGREEISVQVRLPEDERDSLGDLKAYEIPVAGGYIPLGMVAELVERPAPARIERVDGRRITTIYAGTNTEITTGGEVVAHIKSELLPQLRKQHPDLRVTVGGEQEEQSRTTPALRNNFLLALFAIYAVMALAFNAYTQPVILLLTVPFGFIGALAGHVLLGLNLTFLSLFGIIGLSGVIINGGLLMVDFINEKRLSGMDMQQAIVESAQERFRPIFLTSLTTFFGVFPLIMERSVQAQFLIPTAVSLGFGILFGTFLLILLVPALASLHGRWFYRDF